MAKGHQVISSMSAVQPACLLYPVPLLHSTGHPLGCPSSDTVCWLWKMVKKSRAFRSGQLGNIRVLRSVKGAQAEELKFQSWFEVQPWTSHFSPGLSDSGLSGLDSCFQPVVCNPEHVRPQSLRGRRCRGSSAFIRFTC
ncbi:uncharacterized protein [Saccopteryx bilineata]|uniref:uncharacterized protein isoform X4 n=2 Tax=Saccopteryx bilineata TaxID=59482 RepID=UPI00338F97C1